MINFADEPAGPEKTHPLANLPSLAEKTLDTSNQFLVGAVPGKDMITIISMGARLTKAQAVNLAAWLKVIADPDGKEFDRVEEEIKKT